MWRLRLVLLSAGVLILAGLGLVASRAPHPATTIAAPPPATSAPPPATAVPAPAIVAAAEPTPWREVVVSRVVRDPPTPEPARPRTGDPRVTIVDFAYDPPVLRVKAGQRITWTSVGSEGHDAVGDGWWSGALSQGVSFTRSFAPGQYDYFCTAHPDMRGRVIVDP